MQTIIAIIIAIIFFAGSAAASDEYTIVSDTIPSQVVLNLLAGLCDGKTNQAALGDNSFVCVLESASGDTRAHTIYSAADGEGGVQFSADAFVLTQESELQSAHIIMDSCLAHGAAIFPPDNHNDFSCEVTHDDRKAAVGVSVKRRHPAYMNIVFRGYIPAGLIPQ